MSFHQLDILLSALECIKWLSLEVVIYSLSLFTRMLKNKIGIAEKSQETRRDRCGGNAVNQKSLF